MITKEKKKESKRILLETGKCKMRVRGREVPAIVTGHSSKRVRIRSTVSMDHLSLTWRQFYECLIDGELVVDETC